MKEVVFAWKELFNEASEEFILLGFFNKKLIKLKYTPLYFIRPPLNFFTS